MVLEYLTDFAEYLNRNGYDVTQDKITRFLSIKTGEIDFTKPKEILPLLKICFCRNSEEFDSFSRYFCSFYQNTPMMKKAELQRKKEQKMGEVSKEKERIRKAIEKTKLAIKEKEDEPQTEGYSMPKMRRKTLIKNTEKAGKTLNKKEKNLLSLFLADSVNLSLKQKAEVEKLWEQLPEKTEKALLNGRTDEFQALGKIFSILGTVKKEMESDKSLTEIDRMREKYKRLKREFDGIEKTEKKIQRELEDELYSLTQRKTFCDDQLVEKFSSTHHRTEFLGGRSVQILGEGRPAFMDKKFKSLSESEKKQILQYVRENLLSFKTRLGRYLHVRNKQQIDMEQTIQNSCKTGGIPFEIYYQKQQRSRSNLVLMLDISGSCKEASEMLLSFMYLLKDIFAGGCRTYVFINSLYDVTSIMESNDIDEAVQAILNRIPRNGQYSNYYRPLETLWMKNKKYLKKDSFVLFLGDYRNNKNPSGVEWIKNIRARAKKLYFLNTDPIEKWDQGDSIASVYHAYAPMYSVKNASELIAFVQSLR